MMDSLSSDLVRPPGDAENHFLQVLLSCFTLTRRGNRVRLQVDFDDRTPTIWSRYAK